MEAVRSISVFENPKLKANLITHHSTPSELRDLVLMRKKLSKKNDFEKLILSLSTEFINIELHEIEDKINEGMRYASEFLGAEAGMPNSVIDHGLADAVLPLREIPLFVNKIFEKR